jgi:hypothetical protein
MTMTDIDTGKQLVVERLKDLCRRADLTIDRHEWLRGRREIVRLSEDTVSDLPLKGHLGEAARQAVNEKLNKLIGLFTPTKRIGF